MLKNVIFCSKLYIRIQKSKRYKIVAKGAMKMIYRNTWAEINLAAIGHNIRQLKNVLPENHRVMSVIKADGYGHGSVEVAKVAMEEGIDYLVVALLEEAIVLREANIDVPILVIGRVEPQYASVAASYQITLTVYDLEWIQAVQEKNLTEKLAIHLEFETGMNRTGIQTLEQMKDIVDAVKRSEQVHITGAYMHFATADDIGTVQYEEQKQRYEYMLQKLAEYYPHPIITHIGNSAAGIQYPEDMLQYTRFGVATYGLYPSKAVHTLEAVQLQQAFSLYSELMHVKKIRPGDCVSYGATYCAEEEEWVGTIPIGYADGWSRKLQGFYVLIEGKRMPIIGRICMDSMMVKLDKPYEVGKRVTLIGQDQEETIQMDDIADYLETINYEIPCMLTSRIPRVYV